MKILALIRLSFHEALAKKTFLVFLCIVAIFLLLMVIYVHTASMQEMVARLQPNAEDPQGIALQEMLYSIQTGVFGAFFPLAIFFGIFTTADIIPSMLEKGSIEIFLSKPISRQTLLIGKILGGLLVLATTVAVFVIGIWSIFGWTFGLWNSGILLALLPALGAWLSLFALATFFGLLTRSSVVVMIVAYFHGTLLTSLLFSREALLFKFISNEALQIVISGLYWMLPQINDLAMLATNMIQSKPIVSYSSLVQSTVFSVSMIGILLYMFKKKDL